VGDLDNRIGLGSGAMNISISMDSGFGINVGFSPKLYLYRETVFLLGCTVLASEVLDVLRTIGQQQK